MYKQRGDETRRVSIGLKSPKSHKFSRPSTSCSSTELTLPLGLRLHTRNLLTAYVNHNRETGLWITTVNTNQNPDKKSQKSKHLQAFSFRSESEARESAYVNAPPKLIPFDESPHCFNCSNRFNSIFRRASHCRNCGVCICNSCSTHWNKLMIPDTYNTKGSRYIKVCKTCDYLSAAFRHSLLVGNYDAALKLYMTGNINLRCPFLNVRNGQEIMFPIHCAAMGGNVKLLKWLIDVHHCPIKMTNTGNRNSHGTRQLITTSNGRTILDLAVEKKEVDILQYLVNQKKISVSSETGTNATALMALEAVLKAMPGSLPLERKSMSPRIQRHKTNQRSPMRHITQGLTNRPQMKPMTTQSLKHRPQMKPMTTQSLKHRPQMKPMTTQSLANIHRYEPKPNANLYQFPLFSVGMDDSDDESAEYYDENGYTDGAIEDDIDDESVATTIKDPCLICYDSTIDCVLTPCGHQICCMRCSQNMSKCPICSCKCQSIRIFRP